MSEHLINSLPVLGSLWRMIEASETLGRVTAVDSPVSTAHEYYIQIDTVDDSAAGLSFSLSLGEFKRTWQPYNTPRVEGPSVWDRLIRDGDLV